MSERAQRAIDALREPDASLRRVPNTVRQSIAEIIESQLWRDISTAPKTGERILLAKFGYVKGGSFNKWPEDDDPQVYILWWACSGHWSDVWNNWNDGIEPSGLAEPTHWMPVLIPPPPQEQTQ